MKSLDTAAEAHDVQLRVWTRLGPSGRVALALRMSEEARSITLDGIRSRHPSYTAEQARHALFRLTLGDELYRAAWPGRPALAP